MNITAGSSDNGSAGYHALEVHNGESSNINNKDGYLFYTYNGTNYLVGYIGNDTELTLPENYRGEKYVINNYAFYDCDSLTSVVIPNSVTSIGDRAFMYCSDLTSVVIGDSVTFIGNSAFMYCSDLTSVVIGDSVSSIDYQAFYYCLDLTDVYYTSSREEWAKIKIGYNNSYLKNATIHYNYVLPE